jgi:hypothetical protein
LRRERDHVSHSLTPSATVNDRTSIGGTSQKTQFERARCERTENDDRPALSAALV